MIKTLVVKRIIFSRVCYERGLYNTCNTFSLGLTHWTSNASTTDDEPCGLDIFLRGCVFDGIESGLARNHDRRGFGGGLHIPVSGAVGNGIYFLSLV